MKRVKAKGVEVVCKPTLKENKFFNNRVIKDLDPFREMCDAIMAQDVCVTASIGVGGCRREGKYARFISEGFRVWATKHEDTSSKIASTLCGCFGGGSWLIGQALEEQEVA